MPDVAGRTAAVRMIVGMLGRECRKCLEHQEAAQCNQY